MSEIFWFFFTAGAFVFGSGLAIVPFLYGGVVTDYGWLTAEQFLDAVAVAMITPGPVVITTAFIGYLVAGLPGAIFAAVATFLPAYILTVFPAPYFRKYGSRPSLAAIVDGVTAAAIGAIAGAVIVLGRRAIHDISHSSPGRLSASHPVEEPTANPRTTHRCVSCHPRTARLSRRNQLTSAALASKDRGHLPYALQLKQRSPDSHVAQGRRDFRLG